MKRAASRRLNQLLQLGSPGSHAPRGLLRSLPAPPLSPLADDDVTVVAVVASPASVVPTIAVAIVIAVTAGIRPADELRAAIFVTVGIRPAVVSVAIEVKLSALIAIEVRPAINVRRAARNQVFDQSATSVSVLSSIEVWTVDVTRRRPVEMGASTPPVCTVQTKITVAVIAVPIVAYAGRQRSGFQAGDNSRVLHDTPTLIHRLKTIVRRPNRDHQRMVTSHHGTSIKGNHGSRRFTRWDNGNCRG